MVVHVYGLLKQGHSPPYRTRSWHTATFYLDVLFCGYRYLSVILTWKETSNLFWHMAKNLITFELPTQVGNYESTVIRRTGDLSALLGQWQGQRFHGPHVCQPQPVYINEKHEKCRVPSVFARNVEVQNRKLKLTNYGASEFRKNWSTF